MNAHLSLQRAPARAHNHQHHFKHTYNASRRRLTRIAVATPRPAVLQSLDLHSAEESFVQGLGVVPQEWGVPAGHLYCEGKHLCHVPALEHLGISFETGPIELSRDHYTSTLLTAVLNKMERRHVGYWLFDAARNPEAAYLFECQPVLREWLHKLAGQRHGMHSYMLVELGNPAAVQAADWLQSLSSCFGKDLHNIPVAFEHDTYTMAHELLFAWLLEIPEAGACMEVPLADGCRKQNSGDVNQAGLTEHHVNTKNFLLNIASLLPHKPKVLVKQLPATGTVAFNAQVTSGIPSAAALASAAARRPESQAAARVAAAAGFLDGDACVCVTTGLLDSKVPAAAAMHMIMAVKQGLKLNGSQCAAAVSAAASAAVAEHQAADVAHAGISSMQVELQATTNASMTLAGGAGTDAAQLVHATAASAEGDIYTEMCAEVNERELVMVPV